MRLFICLLKDTYRRHRRIVACQVLVIFFIFVVSDQGKHAALIGTILFFIL